MSERWMKVETQLPGVSLAREARDALRQQLDSIRRIADAAMSIVDNPSAASAGAEPDGVEGALILLEDFRAQAALSAAILEAVDGGQHLVRPVAGGVEFDPGFRSVHLQTRTLGLLQEIHRERRSSLIPQPTERR